MGFLEGISDAATTLDFFLAVVVAVGGLVWWLRTRNKVPRVELTNPPPALPLTGIHMGIEEFTTLQRGLRDEARADLATAHGEEKKRLEEKIDALNARLADPDRALAEQQAIITSLEEQLARQGNTLGGDAILEAKAALEAGDFTKARALFEIVAAQTEPDVQTHADAAFALGQIAETEIRWHDAAKHYATAARLNPDFDTLYNASEFAWRAGEYQAAFRHSKDLLAWTSSRGTQEQTAIALNEHALALKAQGDYSEAEALYSRALEIGKATIGTSHQSYATRLNNLANVLADQGRYPEAEALYRRAIEIDRVTIGATHPDHATNINNLALAVQSQGRLLEAEELYREALEIGSATFHKDHPEQASRLSNLALLVLELGRKGEAEKLCLQALEIDEITIGSAHPEYGKHLNNFAMVVQVQGRYGEARRHYVQALVILRDKLGDRHPDKIAVAENLLSLLQSHFPDDPEIPTLQALLAAKP